MSAIERFRALLDEVAPVPWGLDSEFGGSRGLVIGPIPENTEDPNWTTEREALRAVAEAAQAYREAPTEPDDDGYVAAAARYYDLCVALDALARLAGSEVGA